MNFKCSILTFIVLITIQKTCIEKTAYIIDVPVFNVHETSQLSHDETFLAARRIYKCTFKWTEWKGAIVVNKQELTDWVKSIVVAFIFVMAMKTFIFAPTFVDGASMMPTYEDGDRVIVNRMSDELSDIERFDVIVFEAPIGKNYIKRVIGLPGDHIAYEDDQLYINDEPFEEVYLNEGKEQLHDSGKFTQNFTLEQLTGYDTIPDGYLFVLGDNRRKSLDSRHPRVGLVPIDKVLGTTDVRFYPLDKLGIVQ